MLRGVRWLCLIAWTLVVAGPGWARDDVRVMVLPFEVNAMEDLAYLETEIPKIISRNLVAEGAIIVESPVAGVLSELETIRALGVDNAVDYILWGSFTLIGQQFSLDLRLLQPQAEGGIESLGVQGEGLATLSAKISDLSQDLSIRLFDLVEVAEIVIQGNDRIETEAIRSNISTQAGETYLPKRIDADLKSVYQMGFFVDVRVSIENLAKGRRVIFEVKEKPTILGIGISGNKEFDEEKIRENLTLKAGSVLNLARVRTNSEIIEDLYKEEDYHNVKVEYRVTELAKNQVNVEFEITEGQKLDIKKIQFVGNHTFDDGDLRDVMRTKEKQWLISWLTGAGELDLEKLNQDAIAISSFYQNQGFINVKVSDPQIDYKADAIEITIKISEGDRYKLGEVDVSGDLIRTREELLTELKITEDDYFNRGLLQKDVIRLTDVYGDEGYAYAQVTPRTSPDSKNLTVDVNYGITKNQLVFFEEIIIGGNTKTRDKVIRRQLGVYEQEIYNRTAMKAGIQRLHGLGYFQDIKVNTLKGETEDQMILKIDVAEKPTGTVQFGGGFSSADSVFGAFSVDQKNLFGRGQTLKASVELAASNQRFDITFTEPWLFDIPLSAGFNVYKQDIDFDDYGYDKKSLGVKLFGSYPVFRHTRFNLSYLLDESDIKITDEKDASDNTKDLKGNNLTSALTGRLLYDSRNRNFNATRGSIHELEIEYAGLGGDFTYTKSRATTAWYIPLIGKLSGYWRGQVGWLDDRGKTPDYAKFFLGGVNTVRGIQPKDVSPRENPGDNDSALVGSEVLVAFNHELHFPIGEESGLVAIAFMDAGDQWRNSNDFELRVDDMVKTAGGGIRWLSPIGPLRIEYGYVIDEGRFDDAKGGKLEFTMGSKF
jgi:outer membrane protein insertion porin family